MAKEYSPIDLATLASAMSVITDSQEIYVDPAGGSDDTGTGSFENPWQSIYSALEYLEDKHLLSDVTVTIRLLKGIHFWPSTVSFSHPQGNQIQIIGDEPLKNNRTIGTRHRDTPDGIYRYEDSSEWDRTWNLQNTAYDPQKTGCHSNTNFPSFPDIVNPVAGSQSNSEPGSRFAMMCRPFQYGGATVEETINLRTGSLANDGSNGPNDYLVIHPYFSTANGTPLTIQGSMRMDMCRMNLGAPDAYNQHGPNSISPVNNETQEPEYPIDMKGRYDEWEGLLRRFYALGCHRILGISAGPAGTSPAKDFIVENQNTNRNQFRNLDNGNTARLIDLSDPASGDPAGKMYGELASDLKLDYKIPQTYIYAPHLGPALHIEGHRAMRQIQNLCFLAVDRLSSSSPNSAGAIMVDNGSSINIGRNIVINGFGTGIHATSKSSVSWSWGHNDEAPVITKCGTGVHAEDGSSITLAAVVCTGCDDGVVSEKNSTINLQDAMVIASTNNGFSAIDNSHLKCYYSSSLYNGQRQAGFSEMTSAGIQGGGAGFIALNNSSILCYGSISFRSSGAGFHADLSSNIDCSFSDSIDNLGGGALATNGSALRCESVFVKQPGVVGFYAYNNSTILADYACSLYVGVDGPITQDTDEEFGDGVTVSKNSSIDADGITADRAVGNNVVVNFNSSMLSAVEPYLRTLNAPSEGYYSIVAMNGGTIVIDRLNEGDITSVQTGYNASVRFPDTATENYFIVSSDHDTPATEWTYDEDG